MEPKYTVQKMQQAAGVTAVGTIAGRSQGGGKKDVGGENGAEDGPGRGEKSITTA